MKRKTTLRKSQKLLLSTRRSKSVFRRSRNRQTGMMGMPSFLALSDRPSIIYAIISFRHIDDRLVGPASGNDRFGLGQQRPIDAGGTSDRFGSNRESARLPRRRHKWHRSAFGLSARRRAKNLPMVPSKFPVDRDPPTPPPWLVKHKYTSHSILLKYRMKTRYITSFIG
jgi:hypothetical protein